MFVKPIIRLLAYVLFLPITPSIAAITVFAKSVLSKTNHTSSIVPEHSNRIVEAT